MLRYSVFSLIVFFLCSCSSPSRHESLVLLARILEVEHSLVKELVQVISEVSGGFTDYYAKYLVQVQPNSFQKLLSGRYFEVVDCSQYASNKNWYEGLAEARPFEIATCYAHGVHTEKGGAVVIYVNTNGENGLINYYDG